MLLPLIAAVSLLSTPGTAVFADAAWNVDYHYALLGEPKEATTFFHQPNPDSSASLIYTLSDRGVLGAVNPKDGALVWRQALHDHVTAANASFLRAGEGQDVVISGLGQQVAAWSAADGRLVWSHDAPGDVDDVEILELGDGKGTGRTKDAIVLRGGEHAAVHRIDGSSGDLKWEHKLESGDAPYQVSTSSAEVFVVLLHKTMLGYVKIKVVSLDPVSGRKLDEYILSSDSELTSTDTIVAVGANSASPIIAWTDNAHSVVKMNVIGAKGVSSFNIDQHNGQAVERVRLHAPYHINSLSHFLVHYETEDSHWAEVFHIDLKKSKIEKAYSLPKLSGKGAFSTTVSDANIYFTRITPSSVMTVSSVSHGVLGRWEVEGFGVSAAESDDIKPVHAVSEVSIKGDSVSAIRSTVLLSSGEWVLLRGGSPVWQRPEVLASTVSAVFATPAEAEDLVQQLEAEAHGNPVSAYIHRVKRHLQDLRHLPEVLRTLPHRFISGFLGTNSEEGLDSDSFGFHKIIVCATESGRLVALDAGCPDRILWSTRAAVPATGENWTPRLSSLTSGVLTLGTELFNASTGERLSRASTISRQDATAPAAASIQYSMHNGELQANRANRAASEPLWSFVPVDGERVISLVPRPFVDPVASIGKVLGDRNVLYKYLNPNLALLTTVHDASNLVSFYVIDTVSGAILHSGSHTGADLSAPISTILSENWFACSFSAEFSESAPKGHQLVVGEMFESLQPNDRGPLSITANYSSTQVTTEPFTLTQTYQIPEAISKMSVTQTRQGITSRQLLAVLADSGSIVGIPRGIIDPRRPVNRDPTKNEQMEGLMRYAPVIEFDPKWYLNHQREVVGIKNVITSPALLESTSLLFAYGLDVFGTRLSPSFNFDMLGKDFNKFQMLATVAALAVATFVVAPLVTRKQVDTRWQFP